MLRHVIGDRTEGFVFINPQTQSRYVSIHKTFDRVVRRLGLTVNGTKLRIHDLRHIFATWLHREGVNLGALRPLMVIRIEPLQIATPQSTDWQLVNCFRIYLVYRILEMKKP